MAIKIIISTVLLCLSTQIFAKDQGVPLCETIGVEVKSTFVDYQYDRQTTKLISKDLVLGPLEPQWSNETRKMKEVFFKGSSKIPVVDSVEISYMRSKDKKILSLNTHQLEQDKDGLLKVRDFMFDKSVQKPEDRPGIQTYLFKLKNKSVCKQVVEHFHAAEAQ
ncbi:MAG: hypothetical protein EP326_12915 [Deltaproteobacteria bacterium]|nr:MAG: hypothetical protein EP326_12915 [Deltaproteobacteria bacterium]